MDRPEIVLIAMPYFDYTLPSSQLAVLKSYLSLENIKSNCIHAYLHFSKIIGEELIHRLNNYAYAELLFLKYTYPERYRKNNAKIDLLLRNNIDLSEEELELCYKKVEIFIDRIVEQIISKGAQIIAFSITYKQLLPSICIAKRIKNKEKNCKIVFGGSRVSGSLGEKMFDNESSIDCVISGEGEYLLSNYVKDYYLNTFHGRYIHQKVLTSQEPVDLQKLGIPDYRDYFTECKSVGYMNDGNTCFYEVARGCWWNRCTFCSSRRLYQRYREKTPQKVAEELKKIIEEYHAKSLWLLGDCYSFKSYIKLADLLVGYKHECSLLVYSRVCTDINYYITLKKIGVTSVIIGIEALSDSLLLKMNKGYDAIRNIQCLKFCAIQHLNCIYNLFFDYPNYSEHDYQESVNNIELAMAFQPPESLCNMELQFGSLVYENQSDYGILKSIPDPYEQLILPDGANTFLYKYQKEDIGDHYSQKIIDKVNAWNTIFESTGYSTLTYEVINGSVKITDNRKLSSNKEESYFLSEYEAKVFLFCDTIKSRKELTVKFKGLDMDGIIRSLVHKKIIMLTATECLSIPILKEN